MPFIRDSEYILLMDLPTASGKHLSAEDMIKLRRAGIATAWLYGLDWQEYNLDPRSLEDRIARVRDAGMKVIVPLWERHPNNYPQEYYSRLATGLGEVSGRRREQILAPWNEKAQRLYNDTLSDVKARYQAEDVQIVSIYCRAGESVMPAQARYHDEAAKADWERCGHRGYPDVGSPHGFEWLKRHYVKMIADQQRICTDTPWHEAWFGYHLPKWDKHNCGVQWIEDYWKAIRADCPQAEINHITFNLYNRDPKWRDLPDQLSGLRERWGSHNWVGAEYCEGLKDGNLRRSLELGMRGVILAPCHPFTRHEGITDKMVYYIQSAIHDAHEREQREYVRN